MRAHDFINNDREPRRRAAHLQRRTGQRAHDNAADDPRDQPGRHRHARGDRNAHAQRQRHQKRRDRRRNVEFNVEKNPAVVDSFVANTFELQSLEMLSPVISIKRLPCRGAGETLSDPTAKPCWPSQAHRPTNRSARTVAAIRRAPSLRRSRTDRSSHAAANCRVIRPLRPPDTCADVELHEHIGLAGDRENVVVVIGGQALVGDLLPNLFGVRQPSLDLRQSFDDSAATIRRSRRSANGRRRSCPRLSAPAPRTRSSLPRRSTPQTRRHQIASVPQHEQIAGLRLRDQFRHDPRIGTSDEQRRGLLPRRQFFKLRSTRRKNGFAKFTKFLK